MDISYVILIVLFSLFVLGGVIIVHQICYKKKPIGSLFRQKEPFNKNLPIVMLIGQPGVGKTTFTNQIKIKDIVFDQIPDFGHAHINSITIADTPGLNLDSEIEAREDQIKLFRNYFQLCKVNICLIAIVVNFERTDLMKQKIQDSFKYFNKINRQKIIIVTNFQLSENKEQDQEALKKIFKGFLILFLIFTKLKIFFISNTTQQQDIQQQFEELNLYNPAEPLRTNDTLFEDENPEEAKAMQEQLLQITNKVKTCTQPFSHLGKNNELQEILIEQ